MMRCATGWVVLLLAALAVTATAEDGVWGQAGEGVDSPLLKIFKLLLGDNDSDDQQAKTVAELAQNAPGNMSLLIDGVERVGLHQAIADPNFEATILAPTNWAFEVALVKLKITPAQLWTDKAALTNILSYHTIPGKALTVGELKDGQQLTTISQQPLTVKVDRVAGTVIQGATDTAKVLAADIKAGKAIIHVIDTVLIPPKPTM